VKRVHPGPTARDYAFFSTQTSLSSKNQQLPQQQQQRAMAKRAKYRYEAECVTDKSTKK
jgi:hypothetical protein